MSGKKSLEALTTELSKISGAETVKKGPDERFWQPTVDKSNNGYAVIRFLPAPEGEEVPFVRVFSHGFQGPSGLWYIENSLTTIGKNDPVSELNTKLWNSTSDDDSPERKQVRKQKRKLHYISNIYVVKDPGNPENEGKVFLYKYGKKIFNKLNEAMNPKFADEEALNPFDFWEGANFKIKIQHVDGYRNYDKSEFDRSNPLSDNDKELEEIWKKQHSLKAFLEPSNFKSYEDLKERLIKVLDKPNGMKSQRAESLMLDEAPSPKLKSKSNDESPFVDDDEDLDTLDYFKKLAS
jgi:hypothetical protein